MVSGPALLLFDIDGTLLSSEGAGHRAMLAAGRRLFGEAFGFGDLDLSGKIDPQIYHELTLRHPELPMAGAHERFREAYLKALPGELARSEVRPLPGVAEALRILQDAADLTLGLLTGNYGQGARLKLEAAGLTPELFAVTAFGDDVPLEQATGDSPRNELVPVALARYQQRHRRTLPPERVIVIGDTPRDVACAHAHGCRAFAVATGRWDAAALRRAGADVVADDLADLRPLLALLEEPPEAS